MTGFCPPTCVARFAEDRVDPFDDLNEYFEIELPWPIIPTTPLFNSLLDFGGSCAMARLICRKRRMR